MTTTLRSALFLLGGDFLSPSLLSTYLKGRQMVAVLDAIGMDAVTFGNHEFDFGPAVLIERMPKPLADKEPHLSCGT